MTKRFTNMSVNLLQPNPFWTWVRGLFENCDKFIWYDAKIHYVSSISEKIMHHMIYETLATPWDAQLTYDNHSNRPLLHKKMEKNVLCAVTKHLKLWTISQIKVELDKVHGDFASTLKMVYYFWINMVVAALKMKCVLDIQLRPLQSILLKEPMVS